MEQEQQPNTTQQPAQETSGQESVTFQTLVPTKNMPALLSYYFGIAGLIPFLGLPFSIAALITGVMGIQQYKNKPTPGAKGHATAGLILGGLEITVFIIIMLLIALSQ
jgi:hypothetical protein